MLSEDSCFLLTKTVVQVKNYILPEIILLIQNTMNLDQSINKLSCTKSRRKMDDIG